MLTPDQQTQARIRIAEACGWKIVRNEYGFKLLIYAPDGDCYLHSDDKDFVVFNTFPPYFDSIDIIRAAVMQQDAAFQAAFNQAVQALIAKRSTQERLCYYHELSAEDLAICFLQVLDEKK